MLIIDPHKAAVFCSLDFSHHHHNSGKTAILKNRSVEAHLFGTNQLTMGNSRSIFVEQQDWFHQLIFGKHSTKLKVIMWGLPSSGKTSILKTLTAIKQPETITFRHQDDLVPTKLFNMQDFYHTTDTRYRIILYDVGGASGSYLIFISYFIALSKIGCIVFRIRLCEKVLW